MLRNPSSGLLTRNVPVTLWTLQNVKTEWKDVKKNVRKLVCYTSVSPPTYREQLLGVSREMWLFATQFTSHVLQSSWKCRSLNAIASDLEVKAKALGSLARGSLAVEATWHEVITFSCYCNKHIFHVCGKVCRWERKRHRDGIFLRFINILVFPWKCVEFFKRIAAEEKCIEQLFYSVLLLSRH